MRFPVIFCSIFFVPATFVMAQTMPQKAEVTYQGTYSFTESRKTRQPARIDLGKMLAKAIEGDGGSRFEGAITIKATFDGPAVVATVSGTGGVANNSFSGLIRNGTCRLIDRNNMVIYEGSCGPNGFNGTIVGTDRYRNNLKGSFSTTASALVDVTAREVQAAETKRAQDAVAAEKTKVRDAKRAALKVQCDAGKYKACVEMDTLE